MTNIFTHRCMTELTLHRFSKKTSRGELRWHDLLPLLNTKTLDCHLNLAMLLNHAKPMKFEFDVPSKSRLRFTLQVVASMCRPPEPFLREPEASSSIPFFPTLSRVFQKFSKFPQLTPSRSNSWLMSNITSAECQSLHQNLLYLLNYSYIWIPSFASCKVSATKLPHYLYNHTYVWYALRLIACLCRAFPYRGPPERALAAQAADARRNASEDCCAQENLSKMLQLSHLLSYRHVWWHVASWRQEKKH